MPVPDPKTGNICIWLFSCLYFVVIITGATFLFMYITLPDTKSTSWFPIAGLVLVGIPWFSWCLIFLYRCISGGADHSGRSDGGGGSRGGGGGGGSRGGGGGTNVVTPTMDLGGATTNPPIEGPGRGERRVRFGATIVVGEQEMDDDDDNSRTSTSSSFCNEEYHDDISTLDSRESELPLALSNIK